MEDRFNFYNYIKMCDYENAKKIIHNIDIDYISYIFNLHLSNKYIWENNEIVYTVKLFLENGADPNIGSEFYHQKTVLHFAVEMLLCNRNIIKDVVETVISILLDYGANPNQPCLIYNKCTPWHNMFVCKNVKLIKKFLEKGADVFYHIDSSQCYTEEIRQTIEIYRLSILYKEKLQYTERALQKIKDLVYDNLFYRTGGIITSF